MELWIAIQYHHRATDSIRAVRVPVEVPEVDAPDRGTACMVTVSSPVGRLSPVEYLGHDGKLWVVMDREHLSGSRDVTTGVQEAMRWSVRSSPAHELAARRFGPESARNVSGSTREPFPEAVTAAAVVAEHMLLIRDVLHFHSPGPLLTLRVPREGTSFRDVACYEHVTRSLTGHTAWFRADRNDAFENLLVRCGIGPDEGFAHRRVERLDVTRPDLLDFDDEAFSSDVTARQILKELGERPPSSMSYETVRFQVEARETIKEVTGYDPFDGVDRDSAPMFSVFSPLPTHVSRPLVETGRELDFRFSGNLGLALDLDRERHQASLEADVEEALADAFSSKGP